MEYRSAFPTEAPLLGHVEVIFALRGYQPEHRYERLVPDGRVSIVIELDGAERFVVDNDSLVPRHRCTGSWVSGVHQDYFTIGPLPASTELCAVQFRPHGAYPILHKKLAVINDSVVDGRSIFGHSIEQLRTRLVDEDSLEHRLSMIEDWLQRRFDGDLVPHKTVGTVIARLAEDPLTATLAQATAGVPVSRKHLIDLFRRYVGPTPKALHRVLRFAKVLATVQADEVVNWAAVSAACGYSDQPHLIRDFSRFSGYKPSEFLSAGHDRPNFFPVEKSSAEDGSGK